MRHLFQGATLHLPTGPIEEGELLIEDQRILTAGRAVGSMEGAERHDVRGKHICAGFIDAHTHLGLAFEGFPLESKDINEMTAPINIGLRASDGVWPGDVGFNRARAGGVTTVGVVPGSANVYGGLGVALATTGRNVDEMIRREAMGLKIALGFNVKHSHGVKASRRPMTRMAIAAMLREQMEKALRYEQDRLLKADHPEDPDMEILLSALRRELPLRAHVGRSDDIQAAIRFARRYGLKLVLEHAHQAHLITDEIVDAGVDVVLGPFFKTFDNSEKVHLDPAAAARVLDDAGVRVALMTDHPIVPANYLNVQAGLCVRAGVSPQRALAMITSNPAEILGLGDRIGRLSPKHEADFVILDGPPLEIASRVEETWIRGARVYAGEGIPVPGAGFERA